MAPAKRYIAKHAFGVQFEGAFITIAAGQEVDGGTKAGAKLLKQLGKAVDDHFDPYVGQGQFARPDRPDVEQATAAPGEKR